MTADTKSITIQMDASLKERLDEVRRRERISITGFIEAAVTEKLHRMGLLTVDPESLSRLVSHS